MGSGAAAVDFTPYMNRGSYDPTSPLLPQGVLVNPAIFHDDHEVYLGILDELDVLNRVAIHEQQICQRAFLDDPELAGLGAAQAGEREQFRVGGRGHGERLCRRIPLDHF